MSQPQPLLVPVTVEALVVNDHVRLSGRTFMRTPMQYSALQQCANAQAGLSGNDVNFTRATVVPPNNVPASDYYNGVYLKWRLPTALTRGKQDPATGKTTYPKIPNRWLVIRLGGPATSRQAASWIIESDYVWTTSPSPITVAGVPSLYVGPKSPTDTTPVAIYIGRNVPLGAWNESGRSLQLTALAPGNPAFAVYQPHNANVLSFVDVLGEGPDDTLSYQVFGWYSDPADDPLAKASAATFAKELARRHWVLPDGTDPSAFGQTTFFLGSVTGVAWQTAAIPAGGAPGGTSPISISIGNSSVEALTAMIAAQASQTGAAVEPELLEAFQLNLLDVLDEPDGAAILADKIQASFFQRFEGGYGWVIEDAPGETTAIDEAERSREDTWLATLCANQSSLDAAVRQLASLQAQLYVAWWKYVSWPWLYTGSTSVPGLDSQASLQAQIDPTVAGSLAAQVAAQIDTVKSFADLVPGGSTPDVMKAAIQAYGEARQLPASRVLKRVAAQPFHLPNNPVVLISGAGAAGLVPPADRALCRFPFQIVTGFTDPAAPGTTISPATPTLAIPQPDLSGVTGIPWSVALIESLVGEFFLTDPSNAAAISALIPGSTAATVAMAMATPANYGGTYPAGGVEAWSSNPWHPLLMLWQARYYPIGYGSAAAPNWTLQDGDFVWNGAPGSVGQPLSLSGLIQMSPTASVNMLSRIQAFLANAPNLRPQEEAEFRALLDFIQTSDSWDLLSQALNGFNEQLRLRQPGLFLGPDAPSLTTDPPVDILIGDADSYPPALPAIPAGAIPASLYQPWRAGQFVFTNLLLVDEWGQALWPIAPSTMATESLYRPPELMPVRVSPSMAFSITAAPAPAPAPPPPGPVSGPLISTVSPNLIEAGMAPTGEIPVTLTGSGFGPDAVVTWNGTPLPVVIINATELVASVPSPLLMEPGQSRIAVTSGGATSPAALFTVSAGAAIGTLQPASAVAGGPGFTLTATGVGFAPQSVLAWNGVALATTFVSSTLLTAQVPATAIAAVGSAAVAESTGHQVVPSDPASYVQLPPALLQPARLAFDLMSATDDTVPFGPAAPQADPICGFVLPNHLDASLMAYDGQGTPLGEMSVAIGASGTPAVDWMAAPGSPFAGLAAIAQAIPHFGPFLLALQQQGPDAFAAFLQAIDETLWTTQPMGAVFDQELAVLIGRPLAMVRARLQFQLHGLPDQDPSWPFTFQPQPSAVTTYSFPIELGNVARLGDGLIGYFLGDNYGTFNVVQQAGTKTSSYLRPIGTDGNDIRLPFDGVTAQLVSMLVDPRAAVHATTAILPVVTASLPPRLVSEALAAMDVTFRVNGGLTDQTTTQAGVTTIQIPTPQLRTGTWSWRENDQGSWVSFPTGPVDAAAHLSTVSPVLRRGLLQLSSGTAAGPAARPGRRTRPRP